MSGLSLDGVTISYRELTAASAVSFGVEPGEWVVLVGPNGAGKSSLLRAVAGAIRYQGSIRVGDDEVSKLSRRSLARRVALVPQQPVLPRGVAVIDYVLLGRTPHLAFFGSEGRDDEDVAEGALARLDLLDLADRAVDELSGGEAQRAVIARALAQEADILVLDEPTTSLDLGHRQQVLDLVDQLRNEGETVLAAFHDLTAAAAYADRLVLLERGRIAAQGSPVAVLTPDRIAAAYGVEVTIMRDPQDRPIVVPLTASMPGAGLRARREGLR